MKNKFKPIISYDLMLDMLRAQRAARKILKNQKISHTFMVHLLKSVEDELNALKKKHEYKRKKKGDTVKLFKQRRRIIRMSELSLGFLRGIHEDNFRKYESYLNPNALIRNWA